jgi:ParB-like chromosome segregation protein Spo0J
MVPVGGARPPARRAAHLRQVSELSDVHRIPAIDLRGSYSPRHQAEHPEHARLLAESGAELSPIVVHRMTMRVIDGTQRVLAAALRGQAEIGVRFFDGSAEDAFVLAVESNTRHGLPLSLSERTDAARRILRSHPHWSDRVIAAVAGLSAKTVRAQRQRLGDATAERVGRDGRVRPLSSAEGRRLAGRLLQESPDAPLRVIAAQAGISPGTVRDVRSRLSRGEDVVPDRRRHAVAPVAPLPPLAAVPDVPVAPQGPGVPGELDAAAALRGLFRDPSLRLTEDGRRLLRLLEAHIGDDARWERLAAAVPEHRAQLVSALAAHCALQWQRLAARMDGAPATRFTTPAARGDSACA